MTRSDPIFVHAWWRSGSTYVWSKLRQNDSLICYYEPLHERLLHLNSDIIEGSAEIEISRDFRHPQQAKNYFAEYAELLHSKTLRFTPELSYSRYLLPPGQTDEQLQLYLDGLIKAASTKGRTAALCFCRSQMRSAWMKKAFAGAHIAQIRNPADQWVSFNVDSYFPHTMLIIALKLWKLCPLSFTHIEAFERFAQSMSKRRSLPVDQLFQFFLSQKDTLAVFLLIWIASALQAISYCDFVLDIDLLSTEPQYRRTTSQWFQTIGCPIDFSDCASPSYTEFPVPQAEFGRMLRDAAQAIQSSGSGLVIADPSTIRKRLASLSPLSKRALRLALGDE